LPPIIGVARRDHGQRSGKPQCFQTLARIPHSAGNGLARGFPGIAYIEVAFSKMERNLIKRALFPLFRLRQPENLTLGVQQSTLPAHKFLIANFDELVHELHSCRVKPINPSIITESGPAVLAFSPAGIRDSFAV
jgi:hypothetical protein